jgi:hypothetical protein
LRLDPELDKKLQRAATVRGESVSEFIRRAAEERADQTLTDEPAHGFDDVAGIIHGGGGRARRSGSAFTEGLVQDNQGR